MRFEVQGPTETVQPDRSDEHHPPGRGRMSLAGEPSEPCTGIGAGCGALGLFAQIQDMNPYKTDKGMVGIYV